MSMYSSVEEEFVLGDVRAHVGVVEAVADDERLGVVGDGRDELVVHVLVDDGARGGRTRLAGRAERADADGLGGVFDVRAGHHDGRVLAAHLTLDALEVDRGRLGDHRPHGGAAGEGDAVDALALDERAADLAPGAGNCVRNAGRQARVVRGIRGR